MDLLSIMLTLLLALEAVRATPLVRPDTAPSEVKSRSITKRDAEDTKKDGIGKLSPFSDAASDRSTGMKDAKPIGGSVDDIMSKLNSTVKLLNEYTGLSNKVPQHDESKRKKDDKSSDDIIDKFSEIPEFAPNGTVDYDSLTLPAPVKLINDSDTSSFPQSEIEFMQMHERAQVMRIAEVKDFILSKLRLIAPPNMTALKHKLNRFPQHLLPSPLDDTMQSDDRSSESDDFHAKISTIIQFATDFPVEKHPENYPVESIAYFTIPLSVSKNNLEKAILMLYVGTPIGQEDKSVKLVVTPTLNKNKPILTRTVILSARGHWEHIDISDVVRDWASSEDGNYGLIVTAELNGVNLIHLGEAAKKAAEEEEVMIEDVRKRPHRSPLIKMTLNENEGRYKRAFDEVPLSCDLDDRERRCCRYKFVIDFEQMGPDFSFIIQPKRYLANYCAGTCPTYYLPDQSKTTLMSGMARHKLQRCCTPTKMKPLEIIYVDDNGRVVTGLLPGMTIEKCDCS